MEEEAKVKMNESPAPVGRAAGLEELRPVDPAHLAGARLLRGERAALHERAPVRPARVALVRVVVIVLDMHG